MSDRRRRSAASWDKKEGKVSSSEMHSNVAWVGSPKWSNSEVNDGMGRQSWDPPLEKRTGPKDDAINRDRRRMQTDQTFDEWEKPYSTHPSDNTFAPPYRAGDRQVGGKARMSTDHDRDHDRVREQLRSPYRSRSRSRGRAMGLTRSRSRSRDREWESTRSGTRSPFYNDRHESNQYASVRNRSHRPDHTSGSRVDYHRDDRNHYDDQNRRRQSNRNTRIPCRFFAAGKCNRDDCKFSHDIPESRCNDGRSHNNVRDRNIGNKNREWHEQLPHEDINPSDKSSFGEKGTWDAPLWDDVEPRSFNERSRDDIHNHTSQDKNRRDDIDVSVFPDGGKSDPKLDNKKRLRNNMETRGLNERLQDIPDHTSHDKYRTWDDVDASGFPDGRRSNPILDNKKRSWNDVEPRSLNKRSRDIQDHTSHYKNRTWDDVDASNFPDVAKSRSNFINKKRSWIDADPQGLNERSHGIRDHTSLDTHKNWDNKDTSVIPDLGNSNCNLDNKKRSSDGLSWDDVSKSGLSSASKAYYNSEDSKKSWNDSKSENRIDGEIKKWDGPLWDEVSEPGYSEVAKSGWENTTSSVMLQADDNIRKWDDQALNDVGAEKSENLVNQWTSVGNVVNDTDLNNPNIVSKDVNQQVVASGKDSIQIIQYMNSQSLSSFNRTENAFNGPKSQMSGQGEGMDSYKQTSNQIKESAQQLKPSEVDAPQLINAVNDTSLTNQLAHVNGLPTALPEMSKKGQVPELYTQLNLSSAIEYLKSLPHSAYNQDTQQNSATGLEVNTCVPIGTLSASVAQENQNIPPISTGGEIGVAEKESAGIPEGIDNRVAEIENAKQQQESINPGKVEEGDISNDEKAMRLFKVALVEFVKELLKPKWKEGKMSRDVHKTVVKKVVDKVTTTIQGNQVPRTQAKIEQYLAYSKPKITKLVEAYVERLLKE
uniref:uncharacterized protein DDB_G0287625-like n=1 Tax=Erigeron canadensis TaxID=72917 RepID=UPI001CB89243|nr:uncharacterized protein DDB_G0287625-like [Erigeron canadensis]